MILISSVSVMYVVKPYYGDGGYNYHCYCNLHVMMQESKVDVGRKKTLVLHYVTDQNCPWVYRLFFLGI